MIVVGMALVWAGYTVGFYGFCLIKGYDVSFSQLVSPTNWYSDKWPPPLMQANEILPSKAARNQRPVVDPGGGKQDTSGSTGGGGIPVPKSGKCPPGTIRVGSKCIQHVNIP